MPVFSRSFQMMEQFPRPVYVVFVVDEETVECIFAPVFKFFPVSVVPTVFHAHIHSFAVDKS
jgi:hypothetical protein